MCSCICAYRPMHMKGIDKNRKIPYKNPIQHPPPLFFYIFVNLVYYVSFVSKSCKSRALPVGATKFLSLALSYRQCGINVTSAIFRPQM